MNKCTVTVIIPNLNSPVVDQTIAALLPQMSAGARHEIIVVGQDAPGLVHESSVVRFIPTDQPVFPGVARNIGIQCSSSEIVCFLDADCIPNDRWLEQIENRFRDESISVLGGGVDCDLGNFWMLCGHVSSFHEYQVTAPAGTRKQLPSLNLCIRRSALDAVGLFDETRPIAEDSDLTSRLRLHGCALNFDPHVFVVHNPNRVSASAVFEHAWRHGYYSIFVDPHWRDVLGMPLPFRHAFLLYAASPLIALLITAQALVRDRTPLRWWHTAPFLWGLRMAYAWGCAARLRGGNS